MPTNWKPLKALLDTNANSLVLGAGETKEQYVASILEAIEKAELRDNDNKRAATLIAVDAVKAFVQIAIALVIAIVGFVQFSYHSVSLLLLDWLGVAAGLSFLSMVAGFIVISKAYKRGDGRAVKPNGQLVAQSSPWSTETLSRPINFQAGFGVVALLIFAGALAYFNVRGGNPDRFVITLPDGTTKTSAAIGVLVISGSWSALTVEEKGKFAVTVPPSVGKTTQHLNIEVR